MSRGINKNPGNQGNLFMAQFNVGDRIQVLPHVDRWMQGDRYGNVTKIGHKFVHVSMDMSGGIAIFSPENIKKVENNV